MMKQFAFVLVLSALVLIGPALARRQTTRDAAQRPRLAFRLVVDDAKADDPNVEMMTDDVSNGVVAVSRDEPLDGSSIHEVSADADELSIRLTMTDTGAERLKQLTQTNIGRRLAVVLDGKLLTAPRIAAMVSKSVVISSGPGSTKEQTGKLVEQLRSAVAREPSSTTRP